VPPRTASIVPAAPAAPPVAQPRPPKQERAAAAPVSHAMRPGPSVPDKQVTAPLPAKPPHAEPMPASPRASRLHDPRVVALVLAILVALLLWWLVR
jgi:hypothetical protein